MHLSTAPPGSLHGFQPQLCTTAPRPWMFLLESVQLFPLAVGEIPLPLPTREQDQNSSDLLPEGITVASSAASPSKNRVSANPSCNARSTLPHPFPQLLQSSIHTTIQCPQEIITLFLTVHFWWCLLSFNYILFLCFCVNEMELYLCLDLL